MCGEKSVSRPPTASRSSGLAMGSSLKDSWVLTSMRLASTGEQRFGWPPTKDLIRFLITTIPTMAQDGFPPTSASLFANSGASSISRAADYESNAINGIMWARRETREDYDRR